MPSVRGSLTQSGADTFTNVAIETNLTADGKTGWSIKGIRVFWSNGETVPAADFEVNCTLSTSSSTPSFTSPDEILRVSWGMQNSGGVAVAVGYEPIKEEIVFEERVTVQPNIYLGILSANTGIANIVNYQIFYETVKLSDLEVLRLLAGGA